MRYLILLILSVFVTHANSIEWEDKKLFEGAIGSQTISVISSTDTAIFAPIITSFLTTNPELNINYYVASSADVYEEFQRNPQDYDVVISSAMDLQLKLVNDGFSARIEGISYPDWAQWRESLFGFTMEPASIVINKKAFETLKVPRSRQEMIRVLRTNPDLFRGKIGSYDVRQSGLGYLFATQDARASETYWRLMEIMGSLETRLYCCSGSMIEDLSNNTISIAYNVLGSYAQARTDIADKIEIILPSDFPNTMMRTAMVSKHSSSIRSSASFLRFLTSSEWTKAEGDSYHLPPLQAASQNEQRSAIALEPGLMIFLDKLKRKTFIKEWENALIQ